MAVMNQAKFAAFVQKDLSESFAYGYEDMRSNLGAVFTNESPDQAIVSQRLLGNLGSVPRFEGEVSYDDPKQSYGKETEEIEYAFGVKVTKKFRRNDLYGVVRGRVEELGERFKMLREGIGADVFNGAFTTTLTADGLALCHTAHTSDQVGGVSQGNKGTTAMNAVAVESTRRLMVAFKNNRGGILPGNYPTLLIVPTALAETAYEIIQSAGKVDTALNNPNYHKGKYELLVWDNFLTSSTAWFMVNQRLMRRLLKFYEWNPTEFMQAGEFDTLVSKHAGYSSCNVSALDWRFIYGHQPS